MRILIVDDERNIRNTLKEILEYEHHEVSLAENGAVAFEMLEKQLPELMLCDIKMTGMDGIEVLEKCHEKYPELPVVMISGHGNIDTAVECIKKGAYDFIEKPLNLNRIVITIKNVGERSKLSQEVKTLKRKVQVNSTSIIGESEPILHIKDMIDKVASTDARVMITGANGTGKELVARMLHEKSLRKEGPFIEVNCAAIPSELIESELFGHEKGSFTTAIKQHTGKFEQAQNGTLFLDEIGDMSLAAQAKVLRVLQENKLIRVGGNKDISVDVRVVAATNKDLKEEIKKGTFREDLYHRLSVIVIHVPKLAERKDDIPLLADYFLKTICQEYNQASKEISPEAMDILKEMPWTGNIRELRNVIERLIILGEKTITPYEIQAYVSPII